jgi:DNA-binding transcriptional regulator YdaS (Cro superfamily)
VKKSLILRLTGAALAFAVIGTACGGDSGGTDAGATATTEGSTDTTGSTMSATGVDTDAALLNQTLTNLLDSHVYLAGVALEQAVVNGPDSAEAKASAGALDENSQALAGAIESIYGADAGSQFLDLWRKHIGFFVDFTLAKAGGDEKAANQAVKDLDGYRQDFGALIESATEGALTKKQVADALIPHVEHLATAASLLVAGDTKVFAELNKAAEHNTVLGDALSTGIAAQQKLEGDPTSDAAKLQQGLTSLLDSHVYLAGVALEQAVVNGTDSAQAKASAAALDENSKALAGAIESLYGADAGDQFLDLWRKHIGFFVDYTLAQAGGDKAAATKALKDLDGYRQDFGALIESATEGGLSKAQVAEALVGHVESLAAAIDSLIAGDGKVFGLLDEAAHHNTMLGSALAGAIAEQKNL